MQRANMQRNKTDRLDARLIARVLPNTKAGRVAAAKCGGQTLAIISEESRSFERNAAVGRKSSG